MARAHPRPRPVRRPSRPKGYRPRVEPLEDRRLLAAVTVTTTADNGDNGNPPAGSFRDAIRLVNLSRDPENSVAFNFAANDPRHFYYRDDNRAGVSAGNVVVATTPADDSTLPADIDPDY